MAVRTVKEVAVSFLIMYLSLYPIDYSRWTLSLNRFIPEEERSACEFVCLHPY